MDYSLAYNDLLKQDYLFKKVISVVKNIVGGDDFYIIGGAVYRKLNEFINGEVSEIKDFDFIVNKDLDWGKISFPDNFKVSKSVFGSPKLIGKEFMIDLVLMKDVHYLKENNLHFDINYFQKGTATDIQSAVFDFKNKKLLLGSAFNSILNKEIRVNNYSILRYFCSLKGINSEDYLKKLARSLNFKVKNGK
jgi:hypothetical protein